MDVIHLSLIEVVVCLSCGGKFGEKWARDSDSAAPSFLWLVGFAELSDCAKCRKTVFLSS